MSMYARSHRRAPSITGCVCRRTSHWRFIGSSPITLWIGTYAAPLLHLTPQPQRSPRPGQSQPSAPGQAEFVICDQTIEAKIRCLKLLGERLMSRTASRQTAELQIRAALLNRFTALGTPKTRRVA
jgi:hypothetical protein